MSKISRNTYGDLCFCILKGKTTTFEQFERFLDSLNEAMKVYDENAEDSATFLPYICLTFMLDDEGSAYLVRKYAKSWKRAEIVIKMRDDDPGNLRNEFIGSLRVTYDGLGAARYFGFMDGDDQLSEDFFISLADQISGENYDIVLLNSVYRYGEVSPDDMTNDYPSKWIEQVQEGLSTGRTLMELAMNDVVGGQAWGKVYSFHILQDPPPLFGKGLYEDVPFWYEVARKAKNIGYSPRSIYYWRRDNTSSLTRVTPSKYAISESLKNLDKASTIALQDSSVREGDMVIWKRYSIAVLNLIRHAYNTSTEKDKQEYLQTIYEGVNLRYFRPKKIDYTDPKFMENLRKAVPDLDEVLMKFY